MGGARALGFVTGLNGTLERSRTSHHYIIWPTCVCLNVLSALVAPALLAAKGAGSVACNVRRSKV